MKGFEMKHSLLLKHSCQHPRGLAITVTWLLLLIFYGLSGGMNTAQAQARAYVSSPCSQSVFVINTATNSVVTTIAVDQGPFGIKISPDGTRAYVAHNFNNSISVIDTATNTVTDTILIGAPFAIAITSDGAHAY